MAFSAAVTLKVVPDGDAEISATFSQSAGAKAMLDESIPDESSDLLINFALDVSACVALVMLSDQDVKIETNNGSTPDDTIDLVANVPYIWHADDYNSLLLTVDVTKLYCTNASGAAARLRVAAYSDPTP